MLSFALCLFAGAPAVYEVDFRSLPQAGIVPRYEFKVIVEFESLPPIELPIGVGPAGGPTGIAKVFAYPWAIRSGT